MFQDPTFWTLVAFVAFFALIFWLKVPGKVTAQLDERAARIKKELDEAEKLHQEAQHLFAEYQRRQRNAIKEAEEIIAAARAEASALVKQAEAETAATLERRRRQAEEKIAQAEKLALQEVRDTAVEVAIAAAGQVLAGNLQGAAAAAQIDRAIGDVKAKLH
ncbi:MAG TPA: F0F1 ATP synthase subunit B [Ferrovibrio sp.]|jgi:F-type H+-transporting ATPase subunit b|uniref:F0F1 ATP synthase subunit B family protein n=1 Tax=Ferrovibrio sp. TaxID=1917215 RepID=UPI002B4B1EB6|nr:F0F1 ATP synthase subunit B [Ferrovibrio sp.]HLT76535.1 F0F1 ATP synthase subunit B [Ferrovibrio sp.]